MQVRILEIPGGRFVKNLSPGLFSPSYPMHEFEPEVYSKLIRVSDKDLLCTVPSVRLAKQTFAAKKTRT